MAAIPSLDERFLDIQHHIENALGRNGDALPGLSIDDAIRIHDILMSLRHWAGDVCFEDGVFTTMEDKDTMLASMARSFLDDVAFSAAKLRCSWTASIEKSPLELNEFLIQNLEHSVRCLQMLAEPIRVFFDATKERGPAVAVKQMVRSWVGDTGGIPKIPDTKFDITETAEDEATSDTRMTNNPNKEAAVFDSIKVEMAGHSKDAMDQADSVWKMALRGLDVFFDAYLKRPQIQGEMLNILLIGSGIDLKHPYFKEMDPQGHRVSERFCFDFVNQGAPITDLTGYGTHGAQTILEICSTARVYVARVFEDTFDGGDKHVAIRIANAFEWGVKQAVDIICLAVPAEDPLMHRTITTAFRLARKRRDVRVFIATSGGRRFPANMDEIIRIEPVLS